MAFTDNMMIPANAENIYAAETMMNFVYEPEIAAKLAIYVNYLSPVKGIREIVEKEDPDIANNPLIFPPDEITGQAAPVPGALGQRRARDEAGDGAGDGRMSLNRRRQPAAVAVHRPRPAVAADLLPVSAAQPGRRVADDGQPGAGLRVHVGVRATTRTRSATYKEQFGRSILYAGISTMLCLIIAFPLAYFTAFHAGRWKGLILLLIILPFFVSYVLRTVAWQLILSDEGWVVGVFRDLGLIADDGRLLATEHRRDRRHHLQLPAVHGAAAVRRAGEDRPRGYIEAATDLYASRATAFRKVTLPLALPGIFAGSLLTFIPACGDFINAALLGTPNQYMIGNVIQSKFLNILDYPQAAALSFTLMRSSSSGSSCTPACSAPAT